MEQEKTRKNFHKKLEGVMAGRGKVYFQPPASIKLSPRSIVYTLNSMYTKSADNEHYMLQKRYNVIVIDPDPDSTIAEELLREFPKSSFDRRYVFDNLYHDSLTIYW